MVFLLVTHQKTNLVSYLMLCDFYWFCFPRFCNKTSLLGDKTISQLTFTSSSSTIGARRRSGVFIFNFEHCFTPFPSLSIAVFQQVNVIWEEN